MKTKTLMLAAMTALLALPACSQAQTSDAPAQSQDAAVAMKVTHIDAAQASALMTARPNLVVLDVRTPGEFAAGHIDGAVNIDFKNSNFAAQLSVLDKSQGYLIHCRSGGRSTRSLQTFKQAGFSHIIHMDGGMIGWNRASLPTVN